MNLDLTVVEREVYTILDFIGDIGGLQAALLGIFGFIFLFFSVNGFENYLVSLLFRAEKPDGSTWNDAFKYKSTGQEVDHNRLYCIR